MKFFAPITLLLLAACGMNENASSLPASSSTIASGSARSSSSESISNASSVASSSGTQVTSELNQVGMNLWFLSDWDGSKAFADAMKHARPFKDFNWTTNAPADEDGWPLSDCSTVIFALYGPADSGVYKLSFEGRAEIHTLWVNGSFTHILYDSNANTTSCDVTFNFIQNDTGGLAFRYTRRASESETNTGIRNIRLYRPGYRTDGTDVFTAPFLNAMKKARVIRAMEWMAINGNTTVTWAERAKPVSASQCLERQPVQLNNLPAPIVLYNSGSGVCIEHIVQLCNAAGADLWLNIPVLADDGYVENAAKLVLYGSDGANPYNGYTPDPVYPPLDANRKVYVEYANENWNNSWGFDSFYAIRNEVWKLPANHPVRCDGKAPSTDEYELTWRYPAWRLAVISGIFRNVFGDGAMMTRVRPVLMTQPGNGNGTLSSALLWADDYYRIRTGICELNHLYWGTGGSAYYNVNHCNGAASDFFDADNYPSASFRFQNAMDSIWAYNYGLKRVAYEGGVAVDVRDSNWQIFLDDATCKALNADSRMRDVMEKTHTAWSETGGDILMYYCLRGPVYWEFTPDIENLDTPKMHAFENIASSARVRPNLGSLLPGSFTARSSLPYIRTGWGWDSTIGGQPCISGIQSNQFIAFAAHTEQAFSGSLHVRGQTDASGVTLAVRINGALAGTAIFTNSAGLTDSPPLSVTLPDGLAVIRLEVKSGGFSLHSVTVTTN